MRHGVFGAQLLLPVREPGSHHAGGRKLEPQLHQIRCEPRKGGKGQVTRARLLPVKRESVKGEVLWEKETKVFSEMQMRLLRENKKRAAA